MTSDAWLAMVLERADSADERGLVTAIDLDDAPAGAVEALTSARWLVPSTPALSVSCDACHEGHVEVPELVRLTERDEPRAYIACPEAGRVCVDLRRLDRWSVDASAIARTVTTLLDAGGNARALVADRVWRLGLLPAGGRTWQSFLVRGAHWPDGRIALRPSRSRLVFTLGRAAELHSGLWLPLIEVLRLGTAGFMLDGRRLEEECAGAAGEETRTGADMSSGRPRGHGFGALLDCWMSCKGLEVRYLNPSAAYDAIHACVLKQTGFRPAPPPRARFARARSAARSARKKAGGACIWHRHQEPLPSDLASE